MMKRSSTLNLLKVFKKWKIKTLAEYNKRIGLQQNLMRKIMQTGRMSVQILHKMDMETTKRIKTMSLLQLIQITVKKKYLR
jgi:hypothetical protein